MKDIRIGDELTIIVTGNTKNPLCTKTTVKDIILDYIYKIGVVPICIVDLIDGQNRTVGINMEEITQDYEGN